MNTPHTHPRATELLYVVNGTIQAGMIQENGARFVYNEVNAGQATIFPKVRQNPLFRTCLKLISQFPRAPFITNRIWDVVSCSLYLSVDSNIDFVCLSDPIVFVGMVIHCSTEVPDTQHSISRS